MNVYEVITNRIIDSLESGVIPWRQPWRNGGAPANLISKKAYRGVNILLLNSASYSSRWWATYKQVAGKGGQVRKGEKSTPCIFYSKAKSKKVGEKDYFLLRYYNVFNIAQCDGISAPDSGEATQVPFAPIDAAESIVARYMGGDDAPAWRHGGDRACYSPSADSISMPDKNDFDRPENYYATLFHEMAHSSGHHGRLDREGITDVIMFGSHRYSYEELVAETTSSFLCGESGILDTTFDNSAAYIRSWIAKLRDDSKCIVKAAGAASKAADYILDRGAKEDEESEEISGE